MNPILTLGHINPDSDSICSAIALAWFLNQTGKEAVAIRAGELNKETAYVLNRFGFEAPELRSSLTENDRVALVDTNNPEELLPGYDVASIVEIVDHHKLIGGIKSSEPISVFIRPVACTNTLILERMERANVSPSKDIAGIMLAAILSDTLKFTSPTTTQEDRDAAQKLAVICGVDMEELTLAMFDAKSDLSGISPTELIKLDGKVYAFSGKRVMISVLETTKPQNALDLKEEIAAAARDMKAAGEVGGVFLYVVDIIESSSVLIAPDAFEQEIAARAYGVELDGITAKLPGVISRKKQMTPKIEAALA